MARVVLDFPDPDAPGPGATPARRVFDDPVEIVQASTVDAVYGALARVEAAVAAGAHAVGLLTYEAAPAFDPAMRVRTGGRLPLVWFGLFEGPRRVDPANAPEDPAAVSAGAGPGLDWRIEMDRDEHAAAVREVRAAIAEGRTYQANLTTRLRASLADGGWEDDSARVARGSRIDPSRSSAFGWRLYDRMRRAQQYGYHAFFELDDFLVLSASPELFFRTRGDIITTRPMKGTRRRGRWTEEDQAMEAELLGSQKDRAENLMIVDLLRNDLGRICEFGSVAVPQLFGVERYPTVLQLTSTVEGRLRAHVGLAEILDALFPCGSVTGAPKISTMAEIARLERSPREVYCGAIGWLRPDGGRDFSVPIRTAWLDRITGAIEYGTGGGIVWDSAPESEYDELQAKALVVRHPWPSFALLETMAFREGKLLRRDRHLQRLADSAAYFGFRFSRTEVEAALDRELESAGDRLLLVRLTLDRAGQSTTSRRPIEGPIGLPEAAAGQEPTDPVPVALAPDPVDSTDPFLFHKTTHRTVYRSRRAGLPAALFDALLRNERDEVTEFTRGNLVAELDGRLVTPARASGLLAGCLRQELLESGRVQEQTLRVDDLDGASRMWFINSARGWVAVRLVPS